jgi:hypothetical protein
MYFMDHPFPTGFSVSTNLERAMAIFGTEEEAIQRCDELQTASGFNCQYVNISSIASRLRNNK